MILVVFYDAEVVRRLLNRPGVTVHERRHWLLWRRFELTGSPQAVAQAKEVLKRWQDTEWWREQW